LAGRGAAVEKAIAGGIDGRRGEKKGGRRPGKAPTFQRRVVGNYVKRRERGDAVECERGRRERRSSVGRSAAAAAVWWRVASGRRVEKADVGEGTRLVDPPAAR